MARKSRKLSPSEKKCKIFQSSLKEVIRIAKKSGKKATKKIKKSGKKSGFGKKLKKMNSFQKFYSFAPKLSLPKMFKSKTRRFGSGAHGMPQNLLGMMGNNPNTEMSFSQAYTGMSPYQADVHMANVPESLRSNFYSPTPVEYNPTYPPEL